MGHLLFPTKPTARVLRQFAAAWLTVFLLISANEIWRRGNIPTGLATGVVALAGLAGLIRPNTVRLLFIAASVVAFPIGWLVSQITLALMFYGVVTPVAFLFRATGRDALQLRRKTDQSTFWITRGPEPGPERYLKQF